MTEPTALNGAAPFFIVRNVDRAIGFYRDDLGFDLMYAEPLEQPFFAMFGRGSAMIMVKDVGVEALPNRARHADARWDAYVNAPDPDALYAEITARGVTPTITLGDTEEGLRGFEVRDPDGHILFFGRPN